MQEKATNERLAVELEREVQRAFALAQAKEEWKTALTTGETSMNHTGTFTRVVRKTAAAVLYNIEIDNTKKRDAALNKPTIGERDRTLKKIDKSILRVRTEVKLTQQNEEAALSFPQYLLLEKEAIKGGSEPTEADTRAPDKELSARLKTSRESPDSRNNVLFPSPTGRHPRVYKI